ncbi:P-loop containing nucleoside triphosphate hydrolase protein [Hesseltinella vesiculosa]|uniref:RNA helicase n=1 Tax=Hesseltinella vesiculosa TaxID=101127 RepID=A0A1X2GD76_9FUNG|nr:P-loop containing nucleoside triphosphate hydrolase protein [Hesseltinella vesiculosa]
MAPGKRSKSKTNQPKKKTKTASNPDDYETLGGIDSWDWNEIGSQQFMGDESTGFLCLEEISDVEIDYEGDDATGKVAIFKRKKKDNREKGKRANPMAPLAMEDMKDFYDLDTFDEEKAAATETHQAAASFTDKPAKSKKDRSDRQKEQQNDDIAMDNAKQGTDAKRPKVEDVDQSVDVSAWGFVKLAEPITHALQYYKFTEPTPIQAKTLTKALEGRDMVGVAETGSGKTLAFGIPMIQWILQQEERPTGLTGLVLTPTRELAIQVKDHLQNMAMFTDVKVTAIVGGMSIQKQQRVMKQRPDIIVATPGRYWEIISSNQEYMDQLKHIRFLVLDEADRMLEKGHFEELKKLLTELSNKREVTTEWPEDVQGDTPQKVKQVASKYQTLIYTATLDKEIRFNVKSKKKTTAGKGGMADLIDSIEFQDPNPIKIDVTTEKKVASKLMEAKIDCLKTEKDLYVYYFVTRYPGRTILFVNSIDAIRRLVPVFRLLNVEVLGLHAQMQQRQRLKNLDRFKANDKAVLVASDVAARGLDIPLVEHVIHYQLPRSGEIYVHRSGRTARANREGVSLLLCSPDEVKVYHKLCQTLRHGEKYPDFPIDLSILGDMRKRVNLATDLDKIDHTEDKASHEESWLRKMADEMDIEFDEDLVLGKNNKERADQRKQANRGKAYQLRQELSQLLKKQILPMGASARFITGSAASNFVDHMLESEGDASTILPAHAKTRAVDDVKIIRKKKKTSKQ